MPILYTCVLNRRNEVVLEGSYAKVPVNYKKTVLANKSRFEYLQMKPVLLNEEEDLGLFYIHKDHVILVTVAQSVNSIEQHSFLEKIYGCVVQQMSEWTSRGGTNSGMPEPFQEYDAEVRYAGQTKDISKFLTDWNENPDNRSKDVILFKELKELQTQMVENLRLSIDRGEKTESLLQKSETLVETSIQYRKTATQVKRTFCARKWWMIAAVIGVVCLIILLIYLLIKF